MSQYKTFLEAYQAKNAPKPTAAQSTWTTPNMYGSTGQQQLANAYSALNPTWTPPADQNAALPSPISPVKFDAYGDPTYAAGASAVTNAGTHAQAEHDYQLHNGAQRYGYASDGTLITAGADLNPYAEAAVLKKNYDDSVRSTTNSYASQGQLYSGALQNAQGANAYNYGRSSDQLQRTAADFYHGNDQQLQGTQDAGTFQLAQLLGPAFANFLASQKGS